MTLYSLHHIDGSRTFYSSRIRACNAYARSDNACGIDRHEFELTKYLLVQILNGDWPIQEFLKEARTSIVPAVGLSPAEESAQ